MLHGRVELFYSRGAHLEKFEFDGTSTKKPKPSYKIKT